MMKREDWVRIKKDLDGWLMQATRDQIAEATPVIVKRWPYMRPFLIDLLYDKAASPAARNKTAVHALHEMQRAICDDNVRHAEYIFCSLLEHSPDNLLYQAQIAYAGFDILPGYFRENAEKGREFFARLTTLIGVTTSVFSGLLGKGADGQALLISKPVGSRQSTGFVYTERGSRLTFVIDSFEGSAEELLTRNALATNPSDDPLGQTAFRQFAYEATTQVRQEKLPLLSVAAEQRVIRYYKHLRLAA